MDWKVFFATFGAVFVAELADKTQLVGISMSAKSGRPFVVWCGSVCAYIVITAASVFLGAILAKYMKPEFIRYTAATIFILIGVLMYLGRL